MINKNWESKSYLKKEKDKKQIEFTTKQNKLNLTITMHTTHVQIYISNF